MAIRIIRLEKDEILRKKSREVEKIDDKIQNRFRWRIIIKGNMDERANEVLNNCLKNVYDKNLKTTRVTIDVNPNNMF